MTTSFPMWLLRLSWATLPLTAGFAAADALADWSQAPRAVAEILLWGAWVVGLGATFAPRPVGLTLLRTAAPLFVVVAALAAATGAVSALAAAAALAATIFAAVLAASAAIALACAAGVAYGTEVRHPLKVPPGLLVAPVPIAVLLVGTGVVSGPLLLADGRLLIGIAAVASGFAVAGLLARSLHILSRRWAILVPAGLVLVDPMTLAEPVLFPREQIAGLASVDRGRRPAAHEIDLRLGASVRSVVIETREPVPVARALAGRRGARLVASRRVLFAPVRPAVLLRVAAGRRIPVQAATALPTTSSPS